MKLTSLKLTNFRQHVSTAIQFESGITGIIGPNGSGKTSILEAIAFALYSESRTTRDQMLSQHPIGRGVMRIELEFELEREATRVTASFEFRRNPASSHDGAVPLVAAPERVEPRALRHPEDAAENPLFCTLLLTSSPRRVSPGGSRWRSG